MNCRNSQKGAALIISLIMLLVLSIIGVSSVQNVTNAERAQAATRDQNLAFQAAEVAMRVAEDQVQAWRDGEQLHLNSISRFTDPRLTDAQMLDNNNWDCSLDLRQEKGCAEVTDNPMPDVKDPPQFKVECMNNEFGGCYITVKAYGRGNAEVILQTLYKPKEP